MSPGRLIRFSLVADGSFDEVLMDAIRWALRNHLPNGSQVVGQFASPDALGAQRDLGSRLRQAIALYPCELLFVHRDAERESPEHRVDEIRAAASAAGMDWSRVIPIVPIRMTEAWLLFNEFAIRCAANNPNGSVDLRLPPLRDLETIPDPKEVLYAAIRLASELNARRTEKLKVSSMARRVTDFITDFAPLRQVRSFSEFEQSLIAVIGHLAE